MSCPFADDGSPVELPWWEELCLKYGVDPTPPPTFPPSPTPFPREHVERVLAEVTRECLTPALEAAGVDSPEQYTLSYGDLPRRPWVADELLDSTQTLPIVGDHL